MDANANSLLIVDDDRDACKQLSFILRRKGYEADFAHSAQEALVMARDKVYSLMLLDLILPDREGIDAIKAVLAIAPDIPVVVLTILDY